MHHACLGSVNDVIVGWELKAPLDFITTHTGLSLRSLLNAQATEGRSEMWTCSCGKPSWQQIGAKVLPMEHRLVVLAHRDNLRAQLVQGTVPVTGRHSTVVRVSHLVGSPASHKHQHAKPAEMWAAGQDLACNVTARRHHIERELQDSVKISTSD